MKFYVVYKQTAKKEEQMSVWGNELMAIDEAREIDANLMAWESVTVKVYGNDCVGIVPHKIFIAERVTKTILEEVKGMALNDGLEWAIGQLEEYETEDRIGQTYIPEFYDIIDEMGDSYIYDDDTEAECIP